MVWKILPGCIWVVATQIFLYVHPENWGDDPIWLAHIFSDGLVKNHQLATPRYMWGFKKSKPLNLRILTKQPGFNQESSWKVRGHRMLTGGRALIIMWTRPWSFLEWKSSFPFAEPGRWKLHGNEMDVSENSGFSSKSSISFGTVPIFGNTHMDITYELHEIRWNHIELTWKWHVNDNMFKPISNWTKIFDLNQVM